MQRTIIIKKWWDKNFEILIWGKIDGSIEENIVFIWGNRRNISGIKLEKWLNRRLEKIHKNNIREVLIDWRETLTWY